MARWSREVIKLETSNYSLKKKKFCSVNFQPETLSDLACATAAAREVVGAGEGGRALTALARARGCGSAPPDSDPLLLETMLRGHVLGQAEARASRRGVSVLVRGLVVL